MEDQLDDISTKQESFDLDYSLNEVSDKKILKVLVIINLGCG